MYLAKNNGQLQSCWVLHSFSTFTSTFHSIIRNDLRQEWEIQAVKNSLTHLLTLTPAGSSDNRVCESSWTLLKSLETDDDDDEDTLQLKRWQLLL